MALGHETWPQRAREGIVRARCSAVFDTGRGFDTVELDLHEGGAASRARDWLHAVLVE